MDEMQYLVSSRAKNWRNIEYPTSKSDPIFKVIQKSRALTLSKLKYIYEANGREWKREQRSQNKQ